jgi:hypothetical protein
MGPPPSHVVEAAKAGSLTGRADRLALRAVAADSRDAAVLVALAAGDVRGSDV